MSIANQISGDIMNLTIDVLKNAGFITEYDDQDTAIINLNKSIVNLTQVAIDSSLNDSDVVHKAVEADRGASGLYELVWASKDFLDRTPHNNLWKEERDRLVKAVNVTRRVRRM